MPALSGCNQYFLNLPRLESVDTRRKWYNRWDIHRRNPQDLDNYDQQNRFSTGDDGMTQLALFLLTLIMMLVSSSGQRGSLPETLRNLKTVDATKKGTARTDSLADDTDLDDDDDDDVTDSTERKVPEKNSITKLIESIQKRSDKDAHTRRSSSNESLSILNGYVTMDGKPTHIQSMREQLCKAIPFNHTISHEGCTSQTILNNMCAGFCNSMSVPLATSDLSVYSRCGPHKHEEVGIRLTCDRRKRGYKIKKVHVVKECACTALRTL